MVMVSQNAFGEESIMTSPPAPASPNPSMASPGTIKTFGWLNIAFGAILTVCFTCGDGYLLIVPSALRMAEQQQKAVQAQQQAARDAEIRELQIQEDRAETPEAKAEIRTQRVALEAVPPPESPPSLSELFSSLGLDDPRVKAHYAADAVTGLLVNPLLIVAGVGLVRLKSWGRRMAIWVAGLKLARLALLGASMIFVVQPVTNGKLLQAGPPGAPVGKDAAFMSMEWATGLISLIYIAVCAVYPIILLVFLTRPGAKAAVAKPPAGRDF
jgi:hypothetical protein